MVVTNNHWGGPEIFAFILSNSKNSLSASSKVVTVLKSSILGPAPQRKHENLCWKWTRPYYGTGSTLKLKLDALVPASQM